MAGPRFVENYANAYGTTLAGNGGSITSGATAFQVLSGSGAPRAVSTDTPPSGYRAIIDGDTPSANTEIIWVLAHSGSNVTSCVRAAESYPGGCAAGAPVSHNDGVPFRAIGTARTLQHIGRSPAGFGPGSYSLLSWNMDPVIAAPTGQTLTIGQAYAEAIPLWEPLSVTNIVTERLVAGTGLVSCFVGLYDGRGTQLAVSANLATAWSSAAAGSAPFDESYALSGGPIATSPVHPDDWGWIVFLVGQGSTTSPQFGKRSSTASGATLSTGPRRSGYLPTTGRTTLPSPMTPANIDSTAYAFWVALS